jgi:flagellar motility protein MotE (MotC chaperone)
VVDEIQNEKDEDDETESEFTIPTHNSLTTADSVQLERLLSEFDNARRDSEQKKRNEFYDNKNVEQQNKDAQIRKEIEEQKQQLKQRENLVKEAEKQLVERAEKLDQRQKAKKNFLVFTLLNLLECLAN